MNRLESLANHAPLFAEARGDIQVSFEFFQTQRCRVTRRIFILQHVSAFQTSCEIHRQEPADQVTRQSDASANDPQLYFTELQRLRRHTCKHFAYALAMDPFFSLNLLNRDALD